MSPDSSRSTPEETDRYLSTPEETDRKRRFSPNGQSEYFPWCLSQSQASLTVCGRNMTPLPSPPVPKPRARYQRESVSACSLERDENLQPAVENNLSTDIGALSQLVMSTLDQTAGVKLPPAEEAAAEPTDEGLTRSTLDVRSETSYVTVLSCWDTEEADSESSNEEEDTGVSAAPSGADGPMGGDPASHLTTNSHNIPTSPPGGFIPTRPAPPPPRPPGQSERPGKQLKEKIPRAATIRVSRKKVGSGNSTPQSAVVRSSWLDVWKGFRHNVLWATLDGQQMSLWKKRTDRFSELLFHVSSITNVKKQDKGRFSVYFRKKHYDFMAYSEEVQDGWVTSLLASRGQPSPTPGELHGQITIKDPRSRAYAALWGHDLWIYPNKEGYQLGLASFSVPLNVATVKSTGKHSFTLITPYKTFNLSVDSSKDLSIWLDSLSSSIRSALSCSQVVMRLVENPCNKLCGDCGTANPEWASVNLLLVICQACAGQHRALGSSLSKVRSLKMDNKVWTEPLLQLFVTHGNRLANQVWAAAVPAAEQLLPESPDEERSKFIQDKYGRGRYRRVHPLTSSLSLMDQVRQSDLQSPSPILLAERAGQALQTELLRLNEYTEVPPHKPQSTNRRIESASSENDSAACDVLDLREVLSVFVKDGAAHQFEMVTLSDQLICAAEDKETLLTHLVHILKGRVSAFRGAAQLSVLVQPPAESPDQSELGSTPSPCSQSELSSSVSVPSAGRRVERFSTAGHRTLHLPHHSPRSEQAPPPSLTHTGAPGAPGSQDSCLNKNMFALGLKVEGVYRRCGLATKVNRLVDALMTSPSTALLESDEQGVLDAGSALKQYVRQQPGLIPDVQPWLQAAGQYAVSVVQILQSFSVVQVFSPVNKMSAQNLALVLVPSLFQTLNQDLLRLTREFVIHHTLLFLVRT
ncbi:hypothetical protein F2P81_024878 [Scophthalmus maximus]|uniref:Uncharacterized protein n=1 Tax=Scophthalmus maximus TaxID=52904 RepID=A0A6A4RRH0_SCOMX|nr:hypothetical protein F2P81_024878 [Scophthalmus maximus]